MSSLWCLGSLASSVSLFNKLRCLFYQCLFPLFLGGSVFSRCSRNVLSTAVRWLFPLFSGCSMLFLCCSLDVFCLFKGLTIFTWVVKDNFSCSNWSHLSIVFSELVNVLIINVIMFNPKHLFYNQKFSSRPDSCFHANTWVWLISGLIIVL